MRRLSAMKRDVRSSPVHGAPAHRVGALLCLMALMAVMATNPVKAGTDLAAEPFQRMGKALSTLNYEGILVYSHDNRMETLRVVHKVEGGQVQAFMESLNGEPRTLKQDGGQFTCRLSGDPLIAVARRAVGQEGANSRPLNAEDLAPHYLVQTQGEARVANRQTQVVAIIPADTLRYGYRFYLDIETGLPLKLDLIGGDARVIEQLMFTSLVLDPALSAEQVTEPEAKVTEPEASSVATAEARTPVSTKWTFEQLPPGFAMIMSQAERDTGGQEIEHLVLSDGLASISVYVESGQEKGLLGDAHIGAIHAHGAKVRGHQVTVVGEVPAATVQAVASTLKVRDETARD